jgi:glycosyltransferase involved in cell wall biosynthesis
MKKNIGVVTFPTNDAGILPLSNIVDILYPLSNDISLITGNIGYDFFRKNEKIYTYGVKHETGRNIFTRVFKYIYTQLRISYMIVKIARNVDMWVLFLGENLVIPQLIMKILRKKIVFVPTGSSISMSKVRKDPFSKVIVILSNINCEFADRIILYSPNLIKEWNLEKYRNKICIAHEHFLDFDSFRIKKKFDGRENLVGYIGRLSEEKGVLNFVKAIPEIIKESDNLEFLIGGEGQLRDKIKKYLDKENLNDKVNLAGWIPHDKLPDYLNELKLVVLPSYTEGLPNLMLEAMACGTPVLATPVGAIPDVIKDEETGFVMENNSPECIAENVLRALNYPNLDKIVKNARELVEKEFTYEVAVDGYRKILENLGVKNHE